MKVELFEIPGLNASDQTCWKVRALAIDGRSPALNALLDWSESEPANYRKMMKALRLVGQVRRSRDPRKVKRCSHPDHHEIHEMRADKSQARLMFFYHDEGDALVVCTNAYWKGRGSQDTAFKQSSALREIYLRS